MNQPAVDYHPMWAGLGLDLPKHDALLGALGSAYAEIFLSQRGRPEGMKYFDFVMSEVHGLRVQELVDGRKAGRKVIGSFCTFVPEELILAAGGIAVGLCAGADFGTAEAERFLPRTTCPLIKAYFGFALEKVCPYMAASDVVVGENTCDGKKKSYEIFRDLVPSFYQMDLPQTKGAEGRALLRAEYRRFAGMLEELSGRKIDAGSLRSAIGTVNAKRAALHRLARLRRARPSPISGLDALLVNQISFYDDPVRFTGSVNAICDELEGRIARGEGVADPGTTRFVLSGCPFPVPNWKLHSIIEGSGCVVVGEESCVGERGLRGLTLAAGSTVEDLLEAIVDRYMEIDCAIFTPNDSRCRHAEVMAREYGADGVIHYSLQSCTPYQMESFLVERSLEEQGIPVLRIETGFSPEDGEALRTRIEAFAERVRGR